MNTEQLNQWQKSLLETIIQLEKVYDNIIELEVIKKNFKLKKQKKKLFFFFYRKLIIF